MEGEIKGEIKGVILPRASIRVRTGMADAQHARELTTNINN